MKKLAVIRKTDLRPCPFGLPITTACKNAGNSVEQMQSIFDVDKSKRTKVSKANKRIYLFHKTNSRCVYADKIADEHDSVHCDYGEAGEKLRDFPLRPSPFYPRVFAGLGNTGLFAYPIDFYWDNPEARSLFTGIYSVYASSGEVNIIKHSIEPDPLLKELVGKYSNKKR